MKDIGTYEILQELKSNEGSCVLSARDRILQRDAIIKTFTLEGVIPALKQRFCLDVQAAAKLTHPNIALIYDFGEQDSYVFIAMEKLDGEDIRHFIDRQGAMLLEDKIQVMVEVCNGLGFAHQNGVIHHDIRADKIFILNSGKPKILDFAIARGIASKIGPASSSTREYMAPEQLRGQKGSPRSDIFSVAAVFYELLTGKHPFSGENTVVETSSDEAPLITDLRPELPPRLAAIIAKGLSKDPANRFQTAEEFAGELQDVANELAVSSMEASGLETILKEELTEGTEKLEQAVSGEFKKRLPAPAPRICAACGMSNAPDALLCASCSIRLPARTSPPRRLAPASPATVPIEDEGQPRFMTPLRVGAAVVTLVLTIFSIFYFAGRRSPQPVGSAGASAESSLRPSLYADAGAAVSAVPSGDASVNDVRYWEGQNSVRVVVEFNGEMKNEQAEAKSPDRIFVDMSPAKLDPNLIDRQWPVKSGFLRQIQVGQTGNSKVRVALNVGSNSSVTSFQLREPNRLVIDVVSSNTTSSTQTAEIAPPDGVGITPASPTDRGSRSFIRSLGLKISRIAIDAGHGGRDTGTIGPHGLVESELALDVARRLKQLIETTMGANVIMTRNEDVFVSLEQRTGFANEQGADLFISIHANSSNISGINGVETYVMSLSNTDEALEIASRENAASQASIHQLNDVLQKMTIRDYVEESQELAAHVQKALERNTNSVHSHSVKQAPFWVLVGAHMPRILTEIGFISNSEDERLLKKPEYRQQIAAALLEGIKSYSQTLSGTKTITPSQ